MNITNSTPAKMHVSYTVVNSSNCDGVGGGGSGESVVALNPGGGVNVPLQSGQTIGHVIATPDLFCFILGDPGTCGGTAYGSAYYTNGSCSGTNRCGCQYNVFDNNNNLICQANPTSWCIVVSGNTISIL